MSTNSKALLKNKIGSLRAAVSSASGIRSLPVWLEENTRSPSDPEKPYSFLHHEYQIQILGDTSENVYVQKSSQVGMSELSARMAIGVAALYPGSNIIYAMPTTTFAQKFAASRIHPIVKFSPLLNRLADRDVFSTSLMRIGSSHIHISGTQKPLISVPSRLLIIDEANFAGAHVTTARSRLSHNAPGEGMWREFSTPTTPGRGVSAGFETGKQYHYLCRCEHCEQWFDDNPAEVLKIPGFDGALLEWDKTYLKDEKYKVEEAYIACPHCSKPVSRQNLIDPSRRQWVAKYPDREDASYQIFPTAVSFYNTPAKIVEASATYHRKADWVNFTLGLPFWDAETTVLTELVRKNGHTELLVPDNAPSDRYPRIAIGMDVGKESHLCVIALDGRQKKIVHLEKIPQAVASERFVELVYKYRASAAIVDAMPDATLSRACVNNAVGAQVYASFFVRNPPKSSQMYSVDEAEGTIKIPRTLSFDLMVQELNKGKLLVPVRHQQTDTLLSHLGKLSRIQRVSDTTGEEVAAWVSSDSEDHYAFATLYAFTAAKMLDVTSAQIVLPSPSSLISKTKQGENLRPDRTLKVYPY